MNCMREKEKDRGEHKTCRCMRVKIREYSKSQQEDCCDVCAIVRVSIIVNQDDLSADEYHLKKQLQNSNIYTLYVVQIYTLYV